MSVEFFEFMRTATGNYLAHQRQSIDYEIDLLRNQGMGNNDIYMILRHQISDYLRLHAIYIIKYAQPEELMEKGENDDDDDDDDDKYEDEDEATDSFSPLSSPFDFTNNNYILSAPKLSEEEMRWVIEDGDLFKL